MINIIIVVVSTLSTEDRKLCSYYTKHYITHSWQKKEKKKETDRVKNLQTLKCELCVIGSLCSVYTSTAAVSYYIFFLLFFHIFLVHYVSILLLQDILLIVHNFAFVLKFSFFIIIMSTYCIQKEGRTTDAVGVYWFNNVCNSGRKHML